MRCKTCHYSLANLTEHRCPECGNAFDPNDASTYERTRHIPRLSIVNLVIGVCIYAATFFALLQAKAVRPSDIPETVWVTAFLALPLSAIIGVLVLIANAAIRWCLKRT